MRDLHGAPGTHGSIHGHVDFQARGALERLHDGRLIEEGEGLRCQAGSRQKRVRLTTSAIKRVRDQALLGQTADVRVAPINLDKVNVQAAPASSMTVSHPAERTAGQIMAASMSCEVVALSPMTRNQTTGTPYISLSCHASSRALVC